ncbi:MAG: respiratory nitrate reductase subunit gamma [Thermodesulfobacteriota bacterium]
MEKTIITYSFIILTVLIFLWGLYFRMSIYLQGSIAGAEGAGTWKKFRVLWGRTWKNFWKHPLWYTKVLAIDVLFHKKLLDQSFYRWLAHTLIVWGIIIIIAVHIIKLLSEFCLAGMDREITFFSFAYLFETGTFCHFLEFLLSAFGLITLVGCILAIVRRFFLRPNQLLTEEEDIISIFFIFFLVLSGFVTQGLLIAAPDIVSAHYYMGGFSDNWVNYWMAVQSSLLANNAFIKTIHSRPELFWYIHIIPGLLWFIYLPHSKLLHIFTSSVTVIANKVKE